MKELSGILEFKCPYWEDLPDEGLMSREVVEYINETLESIFFGQRANNTYHDSNLF